MSAKTRASGKAKATLDVTNAWTMFDFTGSNGAGWPAGLPTITSSAGSSATINNNRGRHGLPNINDYESIHGNGISSPTSQNFEVVYDVIITNTTGEQLQQFCWRIGNVAGLNQMYQVWMGIDSAGVKVITINEIDASYGYMNKGGSGGLTWSIGDIYHFRVQANGSSHKVRWWEEGDPEPGTWNVEFSDTTYTTGAFGWFSQGGAVGAARSLDWDNIGYKYL